MFDNYQIQIYHHMVLKKALKTQLVVRNEYIVIKIDY